MDAINVHSLVIFVQIIQRLNFFASSRDTTAPHGFDLDAPFDLAKSIT